MTRSGTTVTAAAAVDPVVLGVAVAAAVAGSPEPDTVTAVLRRRAAGEAYAAIGRDLADGLRTSPEAAAKIVSVWCRTASRIDPGYTAGVSEPRRARQAHRGAPVAFRPLVRLRQALQRRAERDGVAVATVLERAALTYLDKPVKGDGSGLRRALAEPLAAIGDRLGGIEHQAAGVGRNLNQLSRFCNTYRELPQSIASELTRIREAHEAVLSELRGIRAALEKLLGGEM